MANEPSPPRPAASARRERHFRGLMEPHWAAGRFVCVGLDAEVAKIPASAQRATAEETLVAFNERIVDATADLVCAYKPNSAFYEQHGAQGWTALARTLAYIRQRAPQVPIILDAKRADIGSTNRGYVESAFELLGADAITVHPYLGYEALEPFFRRDDRGIFVLCRTSNPGSGELQALTVDGEPLYRVVARRVAGAWNRHGNAGLVVGATYPRELADVRAQVGELPLLIPGLGAQGGDVAATVAAARDARGGGMILNSSRGILYAYEGNIPGRDFAEAARDAALELHQRVQTSQRGSR
jgi:orotidine-5'-phosphate decarboxylase